MLPQDFSRHQPRKRFGQHFLHDRHVINRIVAAINPQFSETIVEIGPGLGALTTALLPAAQKLQVIELDRDVIPHLQKNCAGLGELIIYQQDVLTTDWAALAQQQPACLRVVGNLPYNISTPLIFHLLQQAHYLIDMHFMLQKEVVDRMIAKPDTSDYGRLSVMVQYFCQTESLFPVAPGAFSPPPKVDSAVIRLTPYRQLPFVAHDFELLSLIVREAFNKRRKTLSNALKNIISSEQLVRAGVSPQVRAETLSVGQFVAIANATQGEK